MEYAGLGLGVPLTRLTLVQYGILLPSRVVVSFFPADNADVLTISKQ